jgi:hypothetical protein
MARPIATVATVISVLTVVVLTLPASAQPGYCYRIGVTSSEGTNRRGVTCSPDDVVLFLRLNPGAVIFAEAPAPGIFGPRYVVVIARVRRAARRPIREFLYPEAHGGPIAFVATGGRIRTFQSEGRVVPGWRKLDPFSLVPEVLSSLGIPPNPALPPSTRGPGVSPSSPSGSSRPRFDPVAAAFLVTACAGIVAWARRRRRVAVARKLPP